LFSGDTITDRRHWGRHELASAWLREIGRITHRRNKRPLYWLLIVKGHRTYRYMPTFSIAFVPDWRHVAVDDNLVSLRNDLACQRFGEEFDARTGVVRFREPKSRLKPEFAQPTERERSRPDVAFFLDRNPGFVDGHELV